MPSLFAMLETLLTWVGSSLMHIDFIASNQAPCFAQVYHVPVSKGSVGHDINRFIEGGSLIQSRAPCFVFKVEKGESYVGASLSESIKPGFRLNDRKYRLRATINMHDGRFITFIKRATDRDELDWIRCDHHFCQRWKEKRVLEEENTVCALLYEYEDEDLEDRVLKAYVDNLKRFQNLEDTIIYSDEFLLENDLSEELSVHSLQMQLWARDVNFPESIQRNQVLLAHKLTNSLDPRGKNVAKTN